MTTIKGAVLLPESDLTDAELEQVTGGISLEISPLPGPGTLLSPRSPKLGMPVFPPRGIFEACGSGTDDSGAMGCPG